MRNLEGPRLIEGSDLPDVWSKVAKLIRESEKGIVKNLVVHVTQPSRQVPKPLQKHETEIRRWAEELQSVKAHRLPFTHGQRILNWAQGQKKTSVGGRLDQIRDFTVPMLLRNPRTKRAVLVVADPSLDSGMTDDPIPALILVQFRLSDDALHATAYFRAQEMYFFWLVNMFELISLQETICEQMRERSPESVANPGTITTFAFTGYINPTDLERIEASESTTLAIERFGISQMKPKNLEALLESALVKASSKDLATLLRILSNDKQKLDRVRDIDYRGLEVWQAFLETNEERIHPQFKDLPVILRKALLELVSLDMGLEREEHLEELRKRIESANEAMDRLVSVLYRGEK